MTFGLHTVNIKRCLHNTAVRTAIHTKKPWYTAVQNFWRYPSLITTDVGIAEQADVNEK